MSPAAPNWACPPNNSSSIVWDEKQVAHDVVEDLRIVGVLVVV